MYAGNGRSTLNVDRRLDHETHPLAITTADAVGASGVSPWNWQETSGNNVHSTFHLHDLASERAFMCHNS